MAKNTRTKQKNLLMRLNKIKGKKLVEKIEELKGCKELSFINDFVESPSNRPMLKGIYFLDKKTLERNNLPYKENSIAIYLAGERTQGIVAYVHPTENYNPQKLFRQLLELRLNSTKLEKRNYQYPFAA